MTYKWIVQLGAIAATVLGVVVATPGVAARGSAEPTKVEVAFKLTEAKNGTVLLEGKLPLETNRVWKFEQRASKGPEMISMALSARPRDGALSLDVQLADLAADGERVEWQPSLIAKVGEKVEATVDWRGQGRKLEVSVR